MIGAVLVVAAIVIGGLPALSAGVPGDSANGSMVGMVGMAGTTGMSAEANDFLPADSDGGTAQLVGCDALCGDLLHACLAVLTFLAALALPGVRRLMRGAPLVGRAGRERRWAEEESPPWSVLSLSQLSVLRV